MNSECLGDFVQILPKKLPHERELIKEISLISLHIYMIIFSRARSGLEVGPTFATQYYCFRMHLLDRS